MGSVFAWLDNDDTQQRKMAVLIELFKDESTVDELGTGTIRDTIANALFPGTSVVQTRVRYLLFTAWLVRDMAGTQYPGDQGLSTLRSKEAKLIDALLASGETDGVIGRQARGRLKSMPSRAYWASLGRFGIRTWDVSIANHLRAAGGPSFQSFASPDDSEQERAPRGFDAGLPSMPEDLLRAANFNLTEPEAGYLRDRIAASCADSLFAWLALHGEQVACDNVWHHPQLVAFPAPTQVLLDHGRRFHHAIYGAALLYNLMIADLRGDDALGNEFRDELSLWEQDLADESVFHEWDLAGFWTTLTSLNDRIHPATKVFVSAWLEFAHAGNVADDKAARDLITARELKLKGGRARLVNSAARDSWSEHSGLVRLDYRWRVASGHLNDIYAGLAVT